MAHIPIARMFIVVASKRRFCGTRCHGGHLDDVHVPQRKGSLVDEDSSLISAALLEGGRVPSMTHEYKFKSC